MKVRYKNSFDKYAADAHDYSSNFNLSALSEVIVQCRDGEQDSAYTRDLMVLLEYSFTGLCPDCEHFWKDHAEEVLPRLGNHEQAYRPDGVWYCKHDKPSHVQGTKCMCERRYEPRWVPLDEAFKKRDVIIDNYNTRFFEPTTPEDRIRGYTLD